jgi:hypothetical protein
MPPTSILLIISRDIELSISLFSLHFLETKATIMALAALAQDSRLAVFRLLIAVGPLV